MGERPWEIKCAVQQHSASIPLSYSGSELSLAVALRSSKYSASGMLPCLLRLKVLKCFLGFAVGFAGSCTKPCDPCVSEGVSFATGGQRRGSIALNQMLLSAKLSHCWVVLCIRCYGCQRQQDRPLPSQFGIPGPPLSLLETGKGTIRLMLDEASPAVMPAPPYWHTRKQVTESGLYIAHCSLAGELHWVLVVWLSPADFISSLIFHYQVDYQLLNELPDHKSCLLSAVVCTVFTLFP